MTNEVQTQIPFGNDKQDGQLREQKRIPFRNDKQDGRLREQKRIPFGNDEGTAYLSG